jgi:hypothetical protein
MRPAGIVALQVGVENLQHLLDCLEPGAVALDPEVARPLDAGGAMLDLPVLQEELVGVAARPPQNSPRRRRTTGAPALPTPGAALF